MPDEIQIDPWDQIVTLIRQGESDRLREFLDSLSPADIARAISRLEEDEQSGMLMLLAPDAAADLIEELSDAQGADLIEDLSAKDAAAIVEEMDSDVRADLLSELDEEDAEAILSHMDPEEAADARQLLSYPPDTAGGIMVTEFVIFDQGSLVADIIADLRNNAEKYSGIGVQYAYVRNDAGRLVGVLRLRDLVLAPNARPIRDVMVVNPVSVLVTAPLTELEQLFDRYMFIGIPVVDEDGRMTGVVERANLEEAQAERSERRFMQFSGIIGGDELRTMPIASRTALRLTWLSLNLVLSVTAASVILLFDETIVQIGALAMLLPVVGNVSGCSGSQSVAVTIRELTLGIIQPRDFFRVMRQEVVLGLANGIVLGTVLGAFTYLLTGKLGLALVVGGSLATNTVVAVLLGATVPLWLRRVGIDPALAAAPMLSTTVDMFGFLLILSLATFFLL